MQQVVDGATGGRRAQAARSPSLPEVAGTTDQVRPPHSQWHYDHVLVDWPTDPHSDPIRWWPCADPDSSANRQLDDAKGIDNRTPVTEDDNVQNLSHFRE